MFDNKRFIIITKDPIEQKNNLSNFSMNLERGNFEFFNVYLVLASKLAFVHFIDFSMSNDFKICIEIEFCYREFYLQFRFNIDFY